MMAPPAAKKAVSVAWLPVNVQLATVMMPPGFVATTPLSLSIAPPTA
jgi:hypothetical protein